MSYSDYQERIIEYRRHLHKHPELSFKEYETSKYIHNILSEMDHCEVEFITETSLVAVFNKGKGERIGLRADIDALPVKEKADVDFKSEVDDVMHACGHDAHTAILLGAAWYINDHIDEFENEITCIFQHAEELIPGGAQEMVKTGYFDDFDFIYGHHLWTQTDYGKIDVKSGPASANSDLYTVTIQGDGGHASLPHLSVNPLTIGANIINDFETIISRNIDAFRPVVISNTVFKSGDTGSENVIPDTAMFAGSVRTLEIEDRETVKESMKHVLDKYKEVGITYELDYVDGYDAVMNDKEKTEYVSSIVEEYFPGQLVTERPMMGGEDFSAFSKVVPSCYVFIGARKPGYDYNHHHPKFKLLEDSFETGFKMFIEVARNYK